MPRRRYPIPPEIDEIPIEEIVLDELESGPLTSKQLSRIILGEPVGHRMGQLLAQMERDGLVIKKNRKWYRWIDIKEI